MLITMARLNDLKHLELMGKWMDPGFVLHRPLGVGKRQEVQKA